METVDNQPTFFYIRRKFREKVFDRYFLRGGDRLCVAGGRAKEIGGLSGTGASIAS